METTLPVGNAMASVITKITSKSPITFSRVFKNSFQKPKTLTLEIKQVIETVASYPSQRVDSNLQDTIFPIAEFGIKPNEYPSKETRVAWILVPETTTPEQAVEGLKKYPNGIIYKILSNEPILDSNQEYAISQGLKTKNDFADNQVCRYPEGATNKAGEAIGGKLIVDKAGNAQYRRTLFMQNFQDDVDLRYGKSEVYLSPKIAAELQGAGVLAGQSI